MVYMKTLEEENFWAVKERKEREKRGEFFWDGKFLVGDIMISRRIVDDEKRNNFFP